MKTSNALNFMRCLALVVAWFVPNAIGVPYATSLTNNSGIISFRLNEAADSVTVVGNNGALSINLGALPAGLTVVDLNPAGLTDSQFKVVAKKAGSGIISRIGGDIPYLSPRGVTVNVNPASPCFGRVYVANGQTNSNSKGDGIFVHNSDLSETFGQGNVPRTGGITNFSRGGANSPYRIKVGREDDRLYICDWADATGNLYVTDADVSAGSFEYVLKPLTTNFYGTNISASMPATIGAPPIPVGPDNTHGSVAAVEVCGSLVTGNLKIFTIDEDYQTDPSDTQPLEMNSLWEYVVGAGPLPWTQPPNRKLLTPAIGFVSQTMDLARGNNGYLYASDRRTAGGQPGVFVVDANGTPLFDSLSASLALGASADVLADTGGLAVSDSGSYLATITFNNLLRFAPLNGGIPDLSRRFVLALGGATVGRSVAWDAADNLYVVSSGLGVLRAYNLGASGMAVTGSDGTFQMVAIRPEARHITANADYGMCSAVVSYTTPVGTGTGPGLATTQTAGLPSGAAFPVGTTVNTFVVTDAAGNSAECNFDVTVVDYEPPTIVCPADITVPATSADGAEVTFNTTATDNCSDTPSLNCIPESGNTIPIGVSTVYCYAWDDVGNFAWCYFNVTVKGASEQITDLVALVESLSLKTATANSLLVKLRDAGAHLSRGNVQGACGKLKDFIATVLAQAGKNQISQGQADLLIQEAERIRAVLGC